MSTTDEVRRVVTTASESLESSAAAIAISNDKITQIGTGFVYKDSSSQTKFAAAGEKNENDENSVSSFFDYINGYKTNERIAATVHSLSQPASPNQASFENDKMSGDSCDESKKRNNVYIRTATNTTFFNSKKNIPFEINQQQQQQHTNYDTLLPTYETMRPSAAAAAQPQIIKSHRAPPPLLVNSTTINSASSPPHYHFNHNHHNCTSHPVTITTTNQQYRTIPLSSDVYSSIPAAGYCRTVPIVTQYQPAQPTPYKSNYPPPPACVPCPIASLPQQPQPQQYRPLNCFPGYQYNSPRQFYGTTIVPPQPQPRSHVTSYAFPNYVCYCSQYQAQSAPFNNSNTNCYYGSIFNNLSTCYYGGGGISQPQLRLPSNYSAFYQQPNYNCYFYGSSPPAAPPKSPAANVASVATPPTRPVPPPPIRKQNIKQQRLQQKPPPPSRQIKSPKEHWRQQPSPIVVTTYHDYTKNNKNNYFDNNHYQQSPLSYINTDQCYASLHPPPSPPPPPFHPHCLQHQQPPPPLNYGYDFYGFNQQQNQQQPFYYGQCYGGIAGSTNFFNSNYNNSNNQQQQYLSTGFLFKNYIRWRLCCLYQQQQQQLQQQQRLCY